MRSASDTRPVRVTSRMRRSRNPRGQGLLLREEILQAAADLMEDGTDSAVTLRAVARRVGIAAPSIYAHFPDRDAIVLALVGGAFDALAGHLDAASGASADPVERLRAVCAAYLEFADTWPQRYRIMFSGAWDATVSRDVLLPPDALLPPHAASGNPAVSSVSSVERSPLVVGEDAFTVVLRVLTDCVGTGRSVSSDPFTDATALWVGLHGLAQLRSAAPLFPWPPHLTDTLVIRLACLGGVAAAAAPGH